MMNTVDQYLISLSNAQQERLRYMIRDLRSHLCISDQFSFLDMGAGTGSMSIGLALLFPDAKGTLVDIRSTKPLPADVASSIAGRLRPLAWQDLAEIQNDRFDLVVPPPLAQPSCRSAL